MKKVILTLFWFFCFLMGIGCTKTIAQSKLFELPMRFNEHVSVEEPTDKEYIEKTDGTKVYGKRKGFSIDGQKFERDEIRGYHQGKYFYGRIGSLFLKRIVHGKINIYLRVERPQTPNITGRQVDIYMHYYQKGDNGELIIFEEPDLQNILKDCPEALAMVDRTSPEIRKAIRQNANYFNEVFEYYNRGCQAPAK